MRDIGKLISAIGALLVIVPLAAAQSLPVKNPPNILLLLAEDMGSRVGAFGDPVAKTPNLDRLAAEGVRYTNTYTTTGVCATSRAALITGMPAIAFGAQHMRASSYLQQSDAPKPYRVVPPVTIKAFPELLRRSGYFTFTDAKLDYQFSGPQANSGPFTVWDREGGGRFGHDIAWRQRSEGQPFFGMVNFLSTHESALFPPANAQGLFHWVRRAVLSWGDSLENVDPEGVVLPAYYPDLPVVRETVARQYNNIQVMDLEVGRILAELERDGLLESTVVIWSTDHGTALPRGKREVYDSGIKVAMIIRWPEAYRPKNVKPGTVDERMVSFVDLAPTILALAGAEVPAYMSRHSLVGVEEQVSRRYIYATKDRMGPNPDRVRAVRDQRFKYIRNYRPELPAGQLLEYRMNIPMMASWRRLHAEGKLTAVQSAWFEPRRREELYDTWSDPDEVHNIAFDSRYAKVLQRLGGALDQWLAGIKDWGEIEEAQMLEQMWPGYRQPVTAAVAYRYAKEKIYLDCETEGASIGYRVGDGDWQLYTSPLDPQAGQRLSAKAVRYGWAESEPVDVPVSLSVGPVKSR